MKNILLFIVFFGFHSLSFALNLDSYLGDATYLFQGEPVEGVTVLGSIEKEDVFVTPLDQKMTRYIFRAQNYPNRPEIAFITVYQDQASQFYSYMDDKAFLKPADQSFSDNAPLNTNKWVRLTLIDENTLEGAYYPGDLGEQKLTFQFLTDRVIVTITEWEQWFGMIPISKTHTSEFILTP